MICQLGRIILLIDCLDRLYLLCDVATTTLEDVVMSTLEDVDIRGCPVDIRNNVDVHYCICTAVVKTYYTLLSKPVAKGCS